MFRMAWSVVLLFFLVIWLPQGLIRAQSQATTGVITGVVSDNTGGVLPGVTVTLRNVGTGFERQIVTDDAGRYTAALLPVGTYEINAELAGFASNKTTNVVLALGQTLTLNITMKVAAVSETVEVTTGAPLIETARSETSTLIDNKLVSTLPLNGRRFFDLALLTPTVRVERERQQVTIAGQRGINSNINIDGADFNEPFFGGQRGGERSPFAYTVSQEAVREFQVIRGGFSAEFGRSTGGVINVITKSGTNDWHGGAFYYLRHREFSPRDVFGIKRAPTRQQFGGSVGGPIRKDQTHFFAVYDQQVEKQPFNVVTTLTTNVPGFISNQLGAFRTTNDVHTALVKLDHKLTNNNLLTGRYNYSDNRSENGTTTGTSSTTVSNNGLEKDRTHTVVLNLDSVISPKMLNEFRWQYAYEDRPRQSNAPGPETQIRAGGGFGGITFGGRSFLPILSTDSRLQFVENFSYIQGAHNMKAGMDITRGHIDQIFRGNARGVYIFSDLANFLSVLNRVPGATPIEYRQFFGTGRFADNQHEFAFYFQDNMKLRPNLTVNAGLRYEAAFNPAPNHPNPDFPQTARIPSDKKEWQPRLGITWDPSNNGKTVVRLGAGVFYARTPMLLLAQAFTSNGNPFVGVDITLTRPDQFLAVQRVHPEFTYPFVPDSSTAERSAFFTQAGIAGVRPSVSVFAPDFRNPRSVQFSGGIEHELFPNFAVALEYVHANTVHLERIRDINLFPPCTGPGIPSPCPNQEGRPIFSTSRPDPRFNFIRQTGSSARSNYDALVLSVNRRYARRFQILSSYTLSYNRDDDTNERNFAGLVYENAFDLKKEYRWSRLDIRHQAIFSGVIDLPLGFQVSSVINWRTGRPFSALTGVDSNRDGNSGTDRPIINGVPLLRNSFRQPNFFTTDLRASKTFKIRENHRLDFIFEMFNLTNKKNFSIGVFDNENGVGAGQRWGTGQTPLPTFNRIRLADGRLNTEPFIQVDLPFQLQVALKYIF